MKSKGKVEIRRQSMLGSFSSTKGSCEESKKRETVFLINLKIVQIRD
jgi:hypothetical protein